MESEKEGQRGFAALNNFPLAPTYELTCCIGQYLEARFFGMECAL